MLMVAGSASTEEEANTLVQIHLQKFAEHDQNRRIPGIGSQTPQRQRRPFSRSGMPISHPFWRTKGSRYELS